jgi:hypothetical protein
MHPQARRNIRFRLVHLRIRLLQLLARVQLLLQRLNLLRDARVAHVFLSLLLGEGGGAGGCVADLLDERGFCRLRGLFGFVRKALRKLGDVVGFLLAQLLKLRRQALLVLELLVPRPCRVGLRQLALARLRKGIWTLGTSYLCVLLQRIDQAVGKAHGSISAWKSCQLAVRRSGPFGQGSKHTLKRRAGR